MHPYVVRREVIIHARRETVFRFFTEPALFAAWWGEGSTIDPRPNGRVLIQYPNGAKASGEVRDIVEGERITFTFGYESGTPFGPGETLVRFELADRPDGTRASLVHELPSEDLCALHVPGWRYQMAVFAKVAADQQHAGAAATIAGWYEAWSEPDAEQQRRRFAAIVDETVEYRDPWALTSGLDDLLGHIASARAHLGASTVEPAGDIRRSQGVAVADFVARNAGGAETMRGTHVFRFSPGGRILSVAGLA